MTELPHSTRRVPSVFAPSNGSPAEVGLAKYRAVLQSTKSEVDPEWNAKQKVQETMQCGNIY